MSSRPAQRVSRNGVSRVGLLLNGWLALLTFSAADIRTGKRESPSARTRVLVLEA